MTSFDNIIRISIGMGVLYLVAKYLIQLLALYFKDSRQKKRKPLSGDEFEQMIEIKKELLRKGILPGELQQANGRAGNRNEDQVGPKAKNRTLEAYEKEVDFLKRENKSLSEIGPYQEMVQIIRSLQWGDGGELSDIVANFQRSYHYKIERAALYNYLKEIILSDLLINLKRKELPDKKNFSRILSAYSLLKEMSKTLADGQSELWGSFCKRKGLRLDLLEKSLLYLLNDGRENEEIVRKIQSAELTAKDINFNEQGLRYLTRPVSETKSIQEILSDIEEVSMIFLAISPMVNFPEEDQETARKVLGLPPNFTGEMLQKHFKSLAKIVHPDKLASYGIHGENVDVATVNFTIIKKAYDLLK